MSATSVVEKATSDMLIGPDWAVNLDLCDAINNEPSQAREIVKALKKRLTNRSPQVQLLALTVLETLIKNCGDNVHQQVAEKSVLQELVKIVKKKADMRVRDKTLVLLDSWQEAFGGASGRYPQYYQAYRELQKLGVEFPQRDGEHSVPIFTPPQSQPIVPPRQPPQFGHWSPDNSRVDAMEPSPGMPGMSLTDIQNARGLNEVLSEMLSALTPQDRMAAKDDVLGELLDQCRVNQQRVMLLVNTTDNEELLRQGLSLNDELQRVLARHDAIMSGTPLPETSGGRQGHHTEEAKGDLGFVSPRTSSRPETQTSSPVENGSSGKPRSARTIFPSLAPPPSLSTKVKPITKNVGGVVGAAPGDATLDLLSGDAPSSQPSVSSVSSPQALPAEQRKEPVDLLTTSAPDDLLNPFESSPFQATPISNALVPVTPPQHYRPPTDNPVTSDAGVWSGAPVGGSPRQQGSYYGDVQPQTQEPMSGQVIQGQQQYYSTLPQPVVTTPPPWQEDVVQSTPEQQWQRSYQPPYSWNTVNPPQMWNSGQQARMGGMSQNAGTGFADLNSQRSSGGGVGENFGSQYLMQRGSAYGQPSSVSGPSQQLSKSVISPETLFNDLVDLRSVNAKFKGASLKSNTSKAGP